MDNRKNFNIVKSNVEGIFHFIQSLMHDSLWFWDIQFPKNNFLNARISTLLGYTKEKNNIQDILYNSINKEDLENAIIVFNNFLNSSCENYKYKI